MLANQTSDWQAFAINYIDNCTNVRKFYHRTLFNKRQTAADWKACKQQTADKEIWFHYLYPNHCLIKSQIFIVIYENDPLEKI